jgi:cobalt-zinc-cadmium efflux system membrane fusion protein
VFVLTAQGFEKRIVTIGPCDQNYVEIQSGLKPGERYAASNTFLLKADLNKDTVQDDD